MMRLLLALAAIAASPAIAGLLDAGTVGNKFMVTYSIVPDPLHAFSFYSMPRTIREAKKDSFSQVTSNDEDKTTVWCRKNDYRVCVLFDQQGSVAGIQVSIRYVELNSKDSAPGLNELLTPEWRRQLFLGKDVWTATAYFVSKELLQSGGRTMDKNTLTAPDGIFIQQVDIDNKEVGRLAVSGTESNATAAGFTEQACFYGMGKHYFQELSKTSQCENHRPFFLLYGPKTSKLNGFGFTWYGKPSQGRGWFEAPPALVAKQIAPNSPDCMSKWINKYGMFTLHVFFVERPWYTKCC
ncbi:putative salivary gland protein 4 [Frankliniella occidentalis]|uniref:Uncharacterized protein LOC113208012 n=1 Tax=Frankliniella occidentalis TaxID=133901 RepID=A0A6J1SMR6_FRAOC|nr:uncharacterized protein LOC113208012 [Frankliniella occidentalis]KAE8748362.1 putative salivary gland protein 4 [Frankliniella occidentalis]